MPLLEMVVLQQKISSGTALTDTEESRLSELQRRVEDHKARNRVNHQVRARNRGQQTRQAKSTLTLTLTAGTNNSKAMTTNNNNNNNDSNNDSNGPNKTKRASEHQIQAPVPKKKKQQGKKASGENRTNRAKKEYQSSIQQKMTEAARLLVRMYGQEIVYWNHFVDLFDEVMIRESKSVAGMTITYGKTSGKPRYYGYAYTQAALPVIDKVPNTQKQYTVKNFATMGLVVASGETTDVLFAQVVKALYRKEN